LDGKQQLADAISSSGHVADRQLIAAFIRDTASEFATNPFPRTSAAATGQVWQARAVEFRCLSVEAAGLRCLLIAVAALPPGEPLVQTILRSPAHTLSVFRHADGVRLVGAVLYGKPGVPLPVFAGRKRANPAQLDLFAFS
jgi:hypothetical protein